MSADFLDRVAREIWDQRRASLHPWFNVDFGQCSFSRELAGAAIKAIEASGTHAVVPVELDDNMRPQFVRFHDWPDKAYREVIAARPKVLP